MGQVLDNLLSRLTSAYNGSDGSNVNKLMQLSAYHIQNNEDLLTQIQNWRDIDQAQGTTLDKIGGNVQQNRGLATDDIYRVLIKSKILRNMSDGSIETLLNFISFILQCDKSEITIRESWQDGLNATIHVDCPNDKVTATGLSLTQFGTLINLVVAVGIKANVLFEGTFGFSTDYTTSQTDPNGFADDALTTGGTLGATYDPTNDIVLPI